VLESALYSQAASAWAGGDHALARSLESMARVEGAQERALIPGFVCYWPSSRGTDGSVLYDQAGLRASEVESPCVQPARTLRVADPRRRPHQRPRGERRLRPLQSAGTRHGRRLRDRGRFFLTLSYLAGATAGHVLWQPA